MGGGDPGAASWNGAIFSGESLFEGQKPPWELILTESVPEIFEVVRLLARKIFFQPISEEVQPGNTSCKKATKFPDYCNLGQY